LASPPEPELWPHLTKKMRLNSFLLLSLLLPCVHAQSSLAAPALGCVYDPGLHAIRPIHGNPGAALLGRPLHLAFVPLAAAPAPRQNYALATFAGQSLRLVRCDGGVASGGDLPGAIGNPDGVVFSPSGNAAILSDNSGRVQVLSGLPDSPALREMQPSGSAAPGAMAIADDATIAFTVGGSVRVLGPDSSSVPLLFPAAVTVLAFQPETHDLLAVSPSGDVYLARNVDTHPDIRQVRAGDSRTAAPLAVQFSITGSAAFVVNTGGVATVDLNTGAVTTLACQCAPTGLVPLARPGIFRITDDVSARPLFLFDGSSSSSRFWFVPAETSGSAQ
jgi:hypothetical protein